MTNDKVNRCLATLEALAQPLLRAGVYESEEDFLRGLAKEVAWSKIHVYQNRVWDFEKRYQKSYEKFVESILNTATPAQEDDAWDWEEAKELLEAWQQVAKELA